MEGWCALGEWQGVPTAAFALSIQGRSGKEDTQEKRRCPRIIFMLFWLLVQFQNSGVSLHHQQQPFFFWGAFGTSSALFFNSSSRPLSNLGEKEADYLGISHLFCISVLFVLTSLGTRGPEQLKGVRILPVPCDPRAVDAAKNSNLNQITDRTCFSQAREKSAAFPRGFNSPPCNAGCSGDKLGQC